MCMRGGDDQFKIKTSSYNRLTEWGLCLTLNTSRELCFKEKQVLGPNNQVYKVETLFGRGRAIEGIIMRKKDLRGLTGFGRTTKLFWGSSYGF